MSSKETNINASLSGMAIRQAQVLSERKISAKTEVLGGIEELLGEDKILEEYEQAIFEQDLAQLAELIDKRLLKYVKWTEIETGWRLLQKEASEVVEKKKLRNVIASKFKESFAGEMLFELNYQQPLSEEIQLIKIGIIKHNLQLNEFPKTYERLNYYVDDIVKLLDNCILTNPDGIITLPLLMYETPLLRFTNCQIATMDKCLMNYDNLQALILASNYLSDFPGSYLPRNLKLLELYGNLMYHIDLLCTEAPPRLFYLGIGRNYLNPDSGIINLLLLQYLCHLDLSDNDFENLDGLLETFSRFLRLESLELIGNPCSLSINYERKVQNALPTLIYLDGELLDSSLPFDKKEKKDNVSGNDACLQVHVFRIMGFKQGSDRGSKVKKKAPMNQKYRMEIELPLLDMDLREYEIQQLLLGESGEQQDFEETPVPLIDWYIPRPVTPEVETDDQQSQKENQTASKEQKTKADKPAKEGEPTKEDKPTKAGKATKAGKRGKAAKATKVAKPTKANKANAKAAKLAAKKLHEAAIKAREEELKAIEQRYYNYLSRDKPLPVQTKFVSTTTKWAKVMEFKNPCIEVPVPWYMLRKLRDTLRSKVILRLVEVEKKEKTKKETKKGKKGKKDKKGKKEKKEKKDKKEKKGSKKKGKKEKTEDDSEPDKDDKKKKKSLKNKKGIKGKPEDEPGEKQGEKSGSTKGKEKSDSINKTIARISVPLEILKWSENHMGYMWDIKRFCFARPYPDIEDVRYKVPKEKKTGRKTKDKKKNKKKAAKEEEEDVIIREIPSYLTCHFAIGLKREVRDIKALRATKFGKKPRSRTTTSDHKRSFRRKNKRLENTVIGLLENIKQQGETFNSIRNEYENLETIKKITPKRKSF